MGMDWLQLVGLAMALVLVGAAVRSRKLDLGKALTMALVWAALIAVAAILFRGFRR